MSDWLIGAAAAIGLLALASWLALWSFGRFALRARGAPAGAIPAGQGGALDELIPEDGDAAALAVDAAEALAIRLATARMAARSIDVMTYIWSNDRTGRLLAGALAEAAGRGVRVRVLLDDVNLWGRDPAWLALDRVPGIEVRVFNPVRSRTGGIARGIEMLLLAIRYNRRMHGKLWSVDGRLALIGGRNLGDDYFGMARGRQRSLADVDLLLTGGGGDGIVAQAAGVFDDFWNSGLAFPIARLWRGRLPVLPRTGGRRPPKGAAALLAVERAARSRTGRDRAALAAILARRRAGIRLRLIADPSRKALGLHPGPRGGQAWLPEHLAPVLAAAGRSLFIASPYLVPGRAGLAELTGLARRGVAVTLLTNSLAAADHAITHGAYRWYRARLLAAGIAIHEFGHERRTRETLHAKLALIDDRVGYVGSFNFDLRSAWLNTELGVLFDDPDLVAQTRAWLAAATMPEAAYRVERAGRWTVWHRGGRRLLHLEPGTSTWRRLLTFAVGHLPIHRLL